MNQSIFNEEVIDIKKLKVLKQHVKLKELCMQQTKHNILIE